MKYIKKNKVRFISRKFRAVQGFDAFSFIEPIVEGDSFLGTFNILIDPSNFIKKILSKLDIPAQSRVMVIQGDGEVLYSDIKKFEKINITTQQNFNDNLIENLIKAIGRKQQGESSFFYNNEKKKIKLFWKQIPMEKDKWTFVIINTI